MKNNVAIIGNGTIGKVIASLLKSENYNVTIADKDAGKGAILLDATYEKQIEHYLRGKDVVVSATPLPFGEKGLKVQAVLVLDKTA